MQTFGAFVAPSVLAQIGPVQGPMHGWSFGWWPMGGIFWIAFLVIAFFGVAAIIRMLSGDGSPRRHSSSALAILEERYARGEIDREEYEQRRRHLGG